MTRRLHPIFPGDSEMARLCRGFHWGGTPLGPSDAWPEALRAQVRSVLPSAHPMVLMWRPALVQIYSDAFRPVLGDGPEHPGALGLSARSFWKDIWHPTGPQIEGVLASGDPGWVEERLIPVHRNGGTDEVWWTYGYSPVHDERGGVEGVLTICQELTRRVRMEEEGRERESLLAMAGTMARLGGWRVELASGLIHWSDEVCRIHGVPPGTVKTVEEAIGEAFARCADAGTPFDLELQILTAWGCWIGSSSPSSPRRGWGREPVWGSPPCRPS